MSSSITSLTGNGLRDWFIQRVSAVILGVYTLYLTGLLLFSPPKNYFIWHNMWQQSCIRITTLIALIALILHAWVGIWTIMTDYVKPVCLRIPLQVLVYLGLFACLFWGIIIIWGA